MQSKIYDKKNGLTYVGALAFLAIMDSRIN